MSVRGDLRVGETLRGSLRKKSRSYTVMGRVVLKRRDQGGRRFVKREQWSLIDDDGQEFWLEIRRDTNKVVLHEPVPVQPAIDVDTQFRAKVLAVVPRGDLRSE